MQTKIKLMVYLAVWRRPEITELCLIGIQRMRQHPAYEIMFAVISESEMIPLMEKYDIKWAKYENLPVGKKKNYGLSVLSVYDFDYLMEIGSDDLVTNYLLDQYLDYFGKYDFFGISDAAYIESESGLCHRFISYKSTYGAGRVMSRKLLESVGWTLWPDNISRGMDNASIRNVRDAGYQFHQVKHGEYPGLIDVKSAENIWKFNYFMGTEYDFSQIEKHISQAEIDKLKSLQNVSA